MILVDDIPPTREDRCARCPNRLTCPAAAALAAFGPTSRSPAPQRRFSSLSAGRKTATSPSSGRNEQTW